MIDSQNRQKIARELVKYPFKSVLDLGCGFDAPLKGYFSSEVDYQGVDIAHSELKEVFKHNLETGIPFSDKSFDVVFAIETLEHIDNIHLVFNEMKRVSKNEIIIALPNMNHWIYRIRHLFGMKLMNKYIFYPDHNRDRHKWFPTHKASIEFVRFNSIGYQLEIKQGICLYSKWKFLALIDCFFSRFFPELFVYTDFFHIYENN